MIVNQSLIDDLYDGVLEDPPWQTFLHSVCTLLNAKVGGIRLNLPDSHSPNLSVMWVDDEFAFVQKEYLSHRYENLPVLELDIQPGEVKLFRDHVDWDLEQFNDYERKVVELKLSDGMSACYAEPGGLQARLMISRTTDNPVKTHEEALFRGLLPYMERALMLYSRLRRYETENKVYEELMRRLTVGIVLLDRNGVVVSANNMAREMIDDCSELSLAPDRLQFSDLELHTEFEEAFARAVEQRDSGGNYPSVRVLQVCRRDGTSLGLLVKSIQQAVWYEGPGCPVVVLCICDPAIHHAPRQQFVAQLLGLTMSEAALTNLLVDGCSLSEAAAKLKICESTARTTCKRIFAKTGVHRQAELVRLVLRSVAVLS